jgi:glycosyltransferase involved in cell wall biosynthesis
MKVLNLVTNREAQFFQQQVETLASLGVTAETVAVPGRRRSTDEATSSRSPLDYLRFYPRVLRHALSEYDLVHANYGLTGPAALAQPRRPVVLTLWGSDLLDDVGWLSRLCARAADAVIVMSEEMAAELAPIESHVIPHGVDLELFRPMSQSEARASVGWDDDAVQVLFPYSKGRPVKNYDRAADVVAATRERLGVPVELQTVHGVAHERMPLYHNAADALLLTSDHEGSPNSVKEAMACNLPVVATDVGDVAELLDGVARSHVCRTDEALVASLVDVLARRARSDGRAHVPSHRRTGERILSVYESVC